MSEHAAAASAAKPYVHFALGDVACAMPLAAIAGVRLLGEFELRDARGERVHDGVSLDGHVGVAERQHYAAWDLCRLLGIERASFGCWLLLHVQRGTARVPLSQFGKPRKPLEITVYRRKGRDKTAFPNPYEIVLQTYVMPVREFTRGSTGFDATRVRTVRLVFDRTQVGQVVVDDIGFSAIDPAYLAQRN